MKRSLFAVAVTSTITQAIDFETEFARAARRAYLAACVPDAPVSPIVNRERRCASCRVGIVSGRHCFACSMRKKR